MTNFIPGLRQTDEFIFFSVKHLALLDLKDNQRELFRIDRNFEVIKEAYEILPQPRPLICRMVPVPPNADHLREDASPLYIKTLFGKCVRSFPEHPQIRTQIPEESKGMYIDEKVLDQLSYEWIEEAVTLAKERSDGRGAGLPLPLTRQVILADISQPQITLRVRNALTASGEETAKNQADNSESETTQETAPSETTSA